MRVLFLTSLLVLLLGFAIASGGEPAADSSAQSSTIKNLPDQSYCSPSSPINAPDFLGPDRLKDTAALGAGQPRDCSDSAQAVHPSIIVADDDNFPKKYWMAYSPVTSCRGAGDENPRIVCSDDGINWGCEIAPGKTIKNPIFTATDIHRSVNYLSDPELFWIDSETMGLIFRARFGIQVADSIALFLSQSTDGISWSDPKPMLVDREVETGESPFMSPAVFAGDNGRFNMMVVDGRIGFDSRNIIHRYATTSVDSAWQLVDSIDFGIVSNTASDIQQNVWHLDVVRRTDSSFLGLFTMCDIVSYGRNATLYLGMSWDRIRDWELCSGPSMRAKENSWDSEAIYRASGYILPDSAHETLVLYYSALGGPSKTWHIGRTTVELP